MPKVPLLDPIVTPQVTPDFQPAPVLRPAEGAFGGGPQQALERQGEAVQRTGSAIFQRVIEHQQREDAQYGFDVQNDLIQKTKDLLNNGELDKNNIPKGYLNRSLNQAKGSTVQFDQDAQQLYKQYSAMAVGENQKEEFHKIIATHLTAAREQVVGHEAQQTQAAFDNSFQTNMKTTASNASGITDPTLLGKYIDAAQASAGPGWQHSGLDQAGIDAAKQGYAAEIVKNAVFPLLEKDPVQAQAVLDENKDRIPAASAAEIQGQINGKKVDQTILDVFDWADKNARRGPDNTIDRAIVDNHIREMGLPADVELKVMTQTDHRATIDASELAKNKAQTEKSFIDQVTLGQAKGTMKSEDALRLAVTTGGTPSEIANRQALVTNLYSGKAQSFNTWLSSQGIETKGAVKSSVIDVYSAYPKSANSLVRQAAINELQNDWLGKTPEQIRQITAEKLKNVVTVKHWWRSDETAPAWKLDAKDRDAELLRLGELQKSYPESYDAARAKVARDQQPLVYDNIKAVLQQMGTNSDGN